MTRAYILQIYPKHTPEYYIPIIQDIKDKNPDKILIFSLGEITVEYIYEFLFRDIQSWLIENNKYLHVLWAGPDMEISPHILGVNTIGSAFGNVSNVYALKEQYGEPDLSTCTKLFTSYNNNAKFERKYFVDLCAEFDLIKDGVVTYRYPNLKVVPNYEWKYHDGSVLFDEPNFDLGASTSTPGSLPTRYFEGFIDIVCETDSRNGFYIPTEKTAKPLGAMKPFLVISSMHYHKFLYEEYGIEMYEELFDYTFDNEPDLRKRIQGVVRNLVRLRNKFNKNPELRQEIYESIKPKLLRNREMALNTLHTLRSKNKLIPDCLKFITEEADYELLGETVNDGGGKHFYTDKAWHLDSRFYWEKK